MAQQANSFATFDSKNKREELFDKIWNISVDETPTLALVGKTKVDSIHPEWQNDAFRAAASNKVEQGNVATITARSPTVRYDNYTQISEDVGSVTGTQEVVDKAGTNSQYDYEVAKTMVELKKDVEFGFLQNTTAIAPASGTAPQARGLLGWIATNDSFGATGASPNPLPASNTAPTDGTLRSWTEQMLKDGLKQLHDSGAPMGNLYALVPSDLRSTFDGFLAGQTRFDKAEDKTLTATLEVYIGPFGRVKAVNARHMRQREVFIINPEYVKLGTLRPMRDKKLAKVGDSEDFMVNCEWTTIVRNEKALAAIRDLQA